jgi:electron transfer flavoprotein alpha subunit
MILGFVEHARGTPTSLSLEMLTLARTVAADLATPLEAIVIGRDGAESAPVLGTYGVSRLHIADDARLDEYAPEAWARSLAELVARASPDVVLAAASDRGNEVLAHVASSTKLPLAANCTEIRPGNPFTVTRQRWGGSLLEEAAISGTTKLLGVAPHAVEAEPAATPVEALVQAWTPALSDKDFRVRVTRQVESATGKVSLAQARVVVGGGRGVGSAEGFASLEELAGLLGGAVGCSRAVTSLGWRPHADQVGQTGTRIAPDLYIACGISGAIQHMVGCRAAKHILAINTDAAAPIVQQADYAVIGDVQKVLSAVNAEIRKTRDAG